MLLNIELVRVQEEQREERATIEVSTSKRDTGAPATAAAMHVQSPETIDVYGLSGQLGSAHTIVRQVCIYSNLKEYLCKT
jgi:hypothetical protein